MTIFTIGFLVAVSIVTGFLWWKIASLIQDAAKLENENENLTKTSAIKDKQLADSARPPDSPSNVLKWLREDAGNDKLPPVA